MNNKVDGSRSAKELVAKQQKDTTNDFWADTNAPIIEPELIEMMNIYYSDDHLRSLSSTQRYYAVISAYENGYITEVQAKQIISEYCQGFSWEISNERS